MKPSINSDKNTMRNTIWCSRAGFKTRSKWDEAKYEFPVLGWIDISDDSKGLAVIPTTKHRYSPREDWIGLTMAKSPLFQDPYSTFNPLRDAYSYLVDTALNLKMASDRKEAEDIVAKSLESMGLHPEEVKGKRPSEFSGGQLQRVSIARAIIPKPRLIIADEPVSMLDASLRTNILEIFKKLKEEGISFIYITHTTS